MRTRTTLAAAALPTAGALPGWLLPGRVVSLVVWDSGPGRDPPARFDGQFTFGGSSCSAAGGAGSMAGARSPAATCPRADATGASRMTAQQTTTRPDMPRPPTRANLISSSAGRIGRVERLCRICRV